MNLVAHLLSYAIIGSFSPEITANFESFFESLKIALINMVTISMMSAKMATVGLLKIKVFLNKCYDVIISVHDVNNKMLSRETSCIVDMVM